MTHKTLPKLFFLLLLAHQVYSQEVVFEVNLENCPNPPSVYQFDGAVFTEVKKEPLEEQPSETTFTIFVNQPSIYYFGSPPNSLRLLVLNGKENLLTISGKCDPIKEISVENATLNHQFENFRSQLLNLNLSSGRTKALLQKPTSDSVKLELYVKLSEINEKKSKLLEESYRLDPTIGEAIGLGTYLDYLPNSSAYKDEINHFINEFFRQANLSKLNVPNNPFLYEAFRNYSKTLVEIGVPSDLMNTIFSDLLQQVPQKSNIKIMALGGIFATLEQKKHPDLLRYATPFLGILDSINPKSSLVLRERVKATTQFSPGGTPPNFAQENPDGQMLSLSDFKGQYLLLDFWASWCGPCRRENPNVVRMYEKYRDKGFEILGISLDNNKQRWLNAIEKDQLTWPQISDLKGWSNQVAQQYQVTAIPKTFLLDPNGRIIAVNLRGPALEAKLEEIFSK
jgi:peroxiredoxin